MISKTITIRLSEANYEHVVRRSEHLRLSRNAYIEQIITADRLKYDKVYRDFKDVHGRTFYDYLYPNG